MKRILFFLAVLFECIICTAGSCSFGEPTQDDYVRSLGYVDNIKITCSVLTDDELFEEHNLEEGKDFVISLSADVSHINAKTKYNEPFCECRHPFSFPTEPQQFDRVQLPNQYEQWILFPKGQNRLIFSVKCKCHAGNELFGINIHSEHHIVMLDRSEDICKIQRLRVQNALDKFQGLMRQ